MRALLSAILICVGAPAALAQYVSLFGTNITGLRGNPNQLFALARRYRVVFSVSKPSGSSPYEVTHSAAIYVFDAKGQAQFLIAGMDTNAPDIPGITGDLRNVILAQGSVSWWDRLGGWLARRWLRARFTAIRKSHV